MIRTRLFSRCLLFLALSLLLCPPASWGTQDPVAFVQGVYAQFTGQDAESVSDFDLLYPEATLELNALMDKEMACWDKGDDPCNYDASVIVDGQDFDLADIEVAKGPTTVQTMEVTARFTNFGEPREVAYIFVRSGGVWLLDNVQVRGEDPWSLKEMLE